VNVIYKYELGLQPGGAVIVPAGSKLLTVQTQGNKICAWFLVDLKRKETFGDRRFVYWMIATGEMFNADKMTYVATIQRCSVVWHIWMENPVSSTSITIPNEAATGSGGATGGTNV
jgi:hypothetical protein